MLRPENGVFLEKQNQVKSKTVKTLIVGSYSDENSSNCNIYHVGEIRDNDRSTVQSLLQVPLNLPPSLPPMQDNIQGIVTLKSGSPSSHIFATMLSQIFGEHHEVIFTVDAQCSEHSLQCRTDEVENIIGAKSVAINQNLSASLLVRHLLAGGGPQESAF